MTKKSQDNWQKRKDFENEGIDITEWDGLNVEHQNTAKHEFVKWALTRVLYEKDRAWDSEVSFPNSREADILSLGPTDGKPVVYEVETGVTPQRKTDKLEHFYYPFEEQIRDVIIISPEEVPNSLHEAIEFLDKNYVMG